MSKHKYVVKLDGKPIGTRKSDRVYTHAVVRVVDLVARRAWIARPAAEYATEITQSNYDHSVKVAGMPPDVAVQNGNWHNGTPRMEVYTAKDVARSIEISAGGYAFYLEWLRSHALRQFDIHHKDQTEAVVILGYCGRPDLAQKLLASSPADQFDKALLIVPVECLP